MRDPVAGMSHVAILAAILLAPTAAADACRCVPRTAVALARAADAIVVADVTRIDDRDPMARTYRLHVSRNWKTRVPASMVVRSEATTCRAELVPGRRYLIYLKRGGRAYWTDGCSGNLPVADAGRAMAVLGEAVGGR